VIAPCLLCGGGEYRQVLRRDAVDIIRCRKCGLMRVDPLPSRDDVLANYRERFFEGNGSYLPYDADEALRKRSFRRLLTAIERYRQGGRLLDVGCATGLFLEVLGRHWEGIGLDISRYACEIASKRTGRRIECGELTEVDLGDKNFEVVTMWNLIEHVRSPIRHFERANHVLSGDGILALTTGDIDSLAARLLGRHWRLITPRTHLFYFTEQTIKAALAETGFEVLNVTRSGREISLSHLSYILYSVARLEVFRRAARWISSRPPGRWHFYANARDVMTVIARKRIPGSMRRGA